MPDEAAAISLSRMARNARPIRPRRSSHAATKPIPAHAQAVQYTPAFVGVVAVRRPLLPPVHFDHLSGSWGTETASANVARARYTPRKRSAGSPTSTPKRKQTRREAGGVASRFQWW